jgi:predicted RNA binding protein YcfA (HicA-like mRNA interferase family)
MSSKHLRNITLRDYCDFLEHVGCKCIRTKGGHYQYARANLSRPLRLQAHIDPVPEFIILNHLRILGLTRKQFLNNSIQCKVINADVCKSG